MALKKSELYSSLWSSCDELRGGMDASQYKDYVLVLLFIKYVSDKYAGQPFAPITIPPGASFADMVALKGKPDIGDQINKKIIAPLADANKLSDMPDFNDPTKLGSGKEMVERLTNLIAIFENKALDFSSNRADGDDILGDAYEYLMRHFATESGKSKGQFYTPAEVSRVIAQILGVRTAKTSASTTVYDPTCGSGSLLLKVADEANSKLTLYGQEKDAATSGLARMNMILHNNPEALIFQGNTLTDPKFKDGEALKTFDYVVANPPFSDKRWGTGLDAIHDPYDRFQHFGVPLGKQGDYAYLLHIVRSLKSTGKGACILPHGVLFRGNAEADIRKNLVRKGYIKGIIGLPANLFYGTGIPACIIVIDKENAHTRKGIFLIDASGGFIKDGPKNRLRAQDIHRIVDVFTRQLELPRYSRMVSFDEIEKNDFNLNLPRYIDSQTPEDVQDIAGHLQGGIPIRDIDALERYWAVCPNLRSALFRDARPGYVDLAVEKSAIKTTIYGHPEFATFIAGMNAHFDTWRKAQAKSLKVLKPGCHPKLIITEVSEGLLKHYHDRPLIDAYDIYQHLMDYWAETMQDDCYLIAAGGWKAQTYRIIEKDKKDREKDKGWACDLVPKPLVVARFFATEQAAIDELSVTLEGVTAKLTELEEEHGGDEGILNDLSKRDDVENAWGAAFLTAWEQVLPESYHERTAYLEMNRQLAANLAELSRDPRIQKIKKPTASASATAIKKHLKTCSDVEEKKILSAYLECETSISNTTTKTRVLRDAARGKILLMLEQEQEQEQRPESLTELWILNEWLAIDENKTLLKRKLKVAEADLDEKAHDKYPTLTEDEVKALVVDDKWLAVLNDRIHGEMDRVSQQLTQRVKELAERYESPLPKLTHRVAELEAKVNGHLERMGFQWN
jgi:type I restriction enzyme M protein